MNCEVCCDVLKKPITCHMCSYVACYKCVSRFIIEYTIMPKCMKCENPWSRKNLVDYFGQYFVSHKYKSKRENVLFELEKALLPETQPHAARRKMLQDISKEENILLSQISKVRKERDEALSFQIPFDESLIMRKEFNMQIHSLREDINILGLRRDHIVHKKVRDEKKPNSIYVKCPNETCRGFIDSKMKCELCNTKLCKNCHVTLEDQEQHTCKNEDVETVRLLFTNTKNCPSCKALIYKIDGCDQMFCTQCYTAFSWRTCEIVNGRIHNPHYYEYLRRTGNARREIGDIPCGGIPDLRIIQNVFGWNSSLLPIHRVCVHVQFVELPVYNVNNVQDNRDLRIMYLNNEISLDMFKIDLQRREKSREKKREISTILNTFLVVCSDVFRRVIEEKKEEKHEFESIRNYTNELLRDVSRVFKSVVPMVTENWDITRFKHE